MAVSAEARAQRSLAVVASVFAGMTLLITGLWLIGAPPEGIAQPILVITSLVSGAAVMASMGFVGAFGASVRLGIGAGVVVAFTVAQSSSGLSGWWPQLELSVIALLAVIAFQRPLRWAVVAMVVVLGSLAAVALTSVNADFLVQSPTMSLARLARVTAVALVALLAAELLRRGARAIDDSAAVTLKADRSAAFARERLLAEREARRVVHDTALNTLEAVALGVPEQLRPRLRERARADARALATLRAPQTSATELSRALQAGADRHDLTLVQNVTGDGELDPATSSAFAAAAAEAMQNVRRHAGTDHVVVEGRIDHEAAQVRIIDRGGGFAQPAPGRLGVRDSIQGRMRDVGGSASVWSAPGQGTVVELLVGRHEPAAAPVLVDLMRTTLRWLALVAAAVAVVGVLTDTAGIQRPWLALGLVFVTLFATLWLTWLDDIGVPEVATVLAVLAVIELLTPLADPYCSSWLRQSSIPDNRVLLLIAVAALTARISLVLITVAGSVLLGWVAVHLSQRLWPECGNEYALIPLVGLGLVAGATVFGQAIRRQQEAFTEKQDAQRRAIVTAAQTEARRSVELHWHTTVAEDAVALLHDIGAGRRSDSSAEVRAAAAARATALRGFVLLSGAPASVGPPLLALQTHCLRTSTPLIIQGDPTELPDVADPGIASWVNEVRQPELTQVRLTVAVSASICSLLLFAGNVSVAPVTGRGLECWTDADGSWCLWEPDHPDAAVPQKGDSGTADPRRLP